MTYVIDEINVAHMKACRKIEGYYSTYAIKIDSNTALVEHLSRPDTKDKRQAPGMVVPCEDCLL